MKRLAAVIAALAMCATTSAASILTVRGEARLEVPADQFSITLGSTATAATVKEARTEVDATMSKLVEVVTTAGLTRDDEWHTSRYDITPQWEPRPNRTQGSASTWTPKIIGYSVRASIAVVSQKMPLAGTLIARAAKAGANEISALNFSIADPRSSRAEAIQTATKHAITDATTLANAAGVGLIRILQLSLDGAKTTPPRPVEHRYMMANVGRAAFDMDSVPDISGGTVVVTANVTAEWEIAPKTQQPGSTD